MQLPKVFRERQMNTQLGNAGSLDNHGSVMSSRMRIENAFD
jgi:hypothetical protein